MAQDRQTIADLYKALLVNLGAYPSYYIANEGFVALKALVKPWKTL